MIFGEVTKNIEFLDVLENLSCKEEKPNKIVKIVDCGEVIGE